jgi:hypothetical protein
VGNRPPWFVVRAALELILAAYVFADPVVFLLSAAIIALELLDSVPRK